MQGKESNGQPKNAYCMRQLDLNRIHRVLFRFYGSRNFTVYTFVEDRQFINPYSMNLIFNYDPACNIDFMTLRKRIQRCIIAYHFSLNIIKEENKIHVNVIVFDKPSYSDFDFEFSQN
jgi:hypothetical protein